MLNHFFSQRQGWDLAEELTEEGIKTGKPKLLARPLPNGGTGFGFELADTTKNRERIEAQVNRPFEEGQSLTNAQEVPIVLDEVGLEDLNRFYALADNKRDMGNNLLREKGLTGIKRQMAWVNRKRMVRGK